jgi:hypothetical protein
MWETTNSKELLHPVRDLATKTKASREWGTLTVVQSIRAGSIGIHVDFMSGTQEAFYFHPDRYTAIHWDVPYSSVSIAEPLHRADKYY